MLKWCGLVLSVLIAGGWAASCMWLLIYQKTFSKADAPGIYHSAQFGFAQGTFVLLLNIPRIRDSWYLNAYPQWTIRWTPGMSRSRWRGDLGPGTYYGGNLPLWIPFLLTAIPTGILWWRDRRRIPAHCCQKCGYDLTGNTSGVCTECGQRT